MKWIGVMPAMTTCFDKALEVDHGFMTRHTQWLLANGCTGIVSLGSLGEAATLTFAEKEAILRNVKAAAKDAPVVAAISALSTSEAVALAKAAEQAGCSGLMVLPPYVYRGDWRETEAHFSAVITATKLSCMLYNNPIAYGTDFLPEQVQELADEPKFAAVKESTGDTRRINETLSLLGDRYQLLTGVDDLALESMVLGCSGWIAGLVVAFPRETVAIYRLVQERRIAEALEIYRWFLPLLHMDIGPKFVQNIKLVEHVVRGTSPMVRQPRLELVGAEADHVRAVASQGLSTRPDLGKYGF